MYLKSPKRTELKGAGKIYKSYKIDFAMDYFFIKRLWQNKDDEKIHKQFIRFSRGEFKKRFVVNITKQPEKIKVGTSFELANDLIDFIFSIKDKVKVSGLLLTKDSLEELKEKLEKEISFSNIKTKEKIQQIEISGELTAEKEKILSEKSYFMLFDIQEQGIILNMKKKLPKPGKSEERKVDDKFCTLELDSKFWPRVKEEFLFDCGEGKKFKINHEITIKDIILPKSQELKKDFEKLRILAKRKGKIRRIKEIDGKKEITEKEFIA